MRRGEGVRGGRGGAEEWRLVRGGEEPKEGSGEEGGEKVW